jgi:glycosyltransferase involved in cell wall biosynthesis
MRILYLTNGFPYPLTSGYLRHYFLIKEISKHHTVVLLSVVGPKFSSSHLRALQPFTEKIHTFTSSYKGKSIGRRLLRRLYSLSGDYRTDAIVLQMRAAVKVLMKDERFDLVILSGKETYPTIRDLKGVPLVVDMCDATSSRVRGRMQYAKWAQLPILMLDYYQVRRIEKALVKKASHLLFASARDREALLGHSFNQVTVIPNGVDLNFWKRGSAKRGQNKIVFTGAMDYPPNIDASLFLINEILPLVRQSIPDAQILIVGRDPVSKLRRAGEKLGVTVTGYVEDVRPYLEQATVFAAPLRFGAGIQNKILEAMAMEVPVITSPLAAAGLCTDTGEFPPIQVARSTQEFAEQIVQNLDSSSRDSTPDYNARYFIESNFVWNRIGRKLEEVIANVTDGVTT